jgi:uncharacterized membrane protein YphA (DoxX/SURF4 family)
MYSRLQRLLPYTWPIRIALGLMFLYSAYPKLGDLNSVVESVRQYQILPEPLEPIFGYLLPFGELALGITLTLGLFTRLAALGGSLLMIAFMIAISISLLRGGEQPDCGCFSLSGGEPISWWTFGRDLVFLVGLVFPLFDTAHWASLDRYLMGWGTEQEAETSHQDEFSEPELEVAQTTRRPQS